MKRTIKRLFVCAILLAVLYFGSFVFLRASGTLLIASDRDRLYKAIPSKPSSGEMYSPLLGFYAPAGAFERFLPGEIAFGGVKYGVRYEGAYPTEEAERMARWILDGLPDTASDFQGTYNCKFHDDDIVQSVQFRLNDSDWMAWRDPLIASMKRLRRSAEIVATEYALHADYGSSAGYLDVTFADAIVTVTRQIHD